MHSGFIVRPRSREKIRGIAHQILDALQMGGRQVPILHVLEVALEVNNQGYSFEILEPDEMIARVGMKAEGITVHRDNTIALRSDVYSGAAAGVGRDRFTAAHELGHYFLHKNEGLAMLRESEPTTKRYCDSEWQANCFAGEFLVDSRYVLRLASIEDVAKHFGVSRQVAQIQWIEAKKMTQK